MERIFMRGNLLREDATKVWMPAPLVDGLVWETCSSYLVGGETVTDDFEEGRDRSTFKGGGGRAATPLGLFAPLVNGFQVLQCRAFAWIGISSGFFGRNQGRQIENRHGFAANVHRLAM